MTTAIEHEIRLLAMKIGISALGFARCAPSETYAIFSQWLANDHAAGMDYMSRHAAQRVDPRRISPSALSVVAAALRYPVNQKPGDGFSSCAWGRDYHDVMRGQLRTIATLLRNTGHAATARICVDSAPLLEREWAVRAGLGWRGRQGQIVNQQLGSCMVLGFILTDVELAPSPQAINRCGTCRRCLDACPTGALLPNGLVDAHRCISYLTIEHAGDIPGARQPDIGSALFGCDACTAVCPWNRFGSEHISPDLNLDHGPSAEECAGMDDTRFAARFQGTSVHRSGLLRLRRNAVIVLDNRKRRATLCVENGTPVAAMTEGRP
jgi:epoxyqueuosine reductase